MLTLAETDVTQIAKATSDISKESIVLATIFIIFVGTIVLMFVLAHLWGKHGKPALDTNLAIAKEKNTLVLGLERMQTAEAAHLLRIERVADRLEEQHGSGITNRPQGVPTALGG